MEPTTTFGQKNNNNTHSLYFIDKIFIYIKQPKMLYLLYRTYIRIGKLHNIYIQLILQIYWCILSHLLKKKKNPTFQKVYRYLLYKVTII